MPRESTDRADETAKADEARPAVTPLCPLCAEPAASKSLSNRLHYCCGAGCCPVQTFYDLEGSDLIDEKARKTETRRFRAQ